MNSSIYSFADYSVILTQPNYGQYVLSGEGIGDIAVNMGTDRTTHDVAADGNIMISKILGRNGTATVSIQQASDAHKWLLGWYKYLESAAAAQWALATIAIRSIRANDTVTLSFVSPQKLPDRAWQAAGQKISWSLLAADVQQD
jgi:hypothetical protein